MLSLQDKIIYRDELEHLSIDTSTVFNIKIIYIHGVDTKIMEQLFYDNLNSALFAAYMILKTKINIPFTDTISYILIEECLLAPHGTLEHIQDIFLIPGEYDVLT